MSFLPPVAMEITAHAAQFYAEMGKVSASVDAMAASSEGAMTRSQAAMAKMQGIGKAAFFATAAGAAIVGTASIEAAAKFEKSTTLLVTAGGESKAAIGAVRDGILAIASSTGTSTQQLSDGMYVMEKAGYRGADGLTVLKAAAEGAKAENVDLATMTQAVSDVMLDYHKKSGDAVSVTNSMVTASGLAKTTMQDFAGSMASIIPIGSAMGISFDQLGGAIASMTQHGESAQQSTQNLANLVQNLSKPSNIASGAMNQLGIDVTDLTGHLGERGLTGSLKIVTDAITAHMGPAGLVVQDTMKKSATATQDLQAMMSKMPANLAQSSKAFLDGSMSMKDYQTGFKGMGAEGDAQGKQFMTLAQTAKGYNDQIKGGTPQFQTYNAMLSKMTGGITGLKTSLMLTGENTQAFNDNVAKIGASAQQTGTDISTWGDTSATTAVKLDQVKETVGVLGIKLGGMLLPAVKGIADGFLSFTKYLSENQPVAIGLGIAIGTLVVGLSSFYVVTKTIAVAQGIWKVATLASAAAQWVLNAAMDANPIGLVVIAIAALVAGIVWVATQTTFFQDVWKGLTSFISDAVTNVVSFVKDHWGLLLSFIIGPLGLVIQWIVEHWSGITAFFATVWNGIVSGVRGFIAGFVSVFSSIVNFLMPVINMVKAILSVFGAIFDFIGGLIQIAVTLWIRGFMVLSSAVSSIFTAIGSFVSDVWNNIVDWVTGAVNNVFTVVSDVWNALIGVVSGPLNTIWGFISSVWSTITSYTSSVWGTIVSTIGGFVGNIVSGVSGGIGQVVDFFSGLLGKVMGAIGDAGSWLVGIGKDIINGLITGITSMAKNAAATVAKVGSDILNSIKHALDSHSPSRKMHEIGMWAIQGLANGISENAHLALSAMGDVASGISGGINIGAPAFAAASNPGSLGMGTGTGSGSGYSPIGSSMGSTSNTSNQRVNNITVQVQQTNATGRQIASDIGYALLLQ